MVATGIANTIDYFTPLSDYRTVMNLSVEEDSPRNVFSRKENVGDDDGDDEEDRISSDCSNGDGNVDLQDSEFTVDSLTNEPISST